jgi:hypothetical protein
MFAARISQDSRVLVRLSRRGCETICILSGIKIMGECSDVAVP